MTSVPFDVPITDNNILEVNKSFNLIIIRNSLTNKVTLGTPSQARVTIMDDDGKYVLKCDFIVKSTVGAMM